MHCASTLIQNRFAAQEAPRPKAPKGNCRANGSTARKRSTLTERQRAFPLLQKASERIAEEVEHRSGRYLRRLDQIHASGSRTHQQRWDALDDLKEVMMTRMDLVTLVLGWVDEQGELHLNRQCGLVDDSDLTPSRVSRTLKALEQAGYLSRKITHHFKQGQWVTHIAIRLRPQFFIDLGLGHELNKVQERKQKQRAQQLQEAAGKRQQQKLMGDAQQQIRRESHARAQGKRRVEQEQQRVQRQPYVAGRSRQRTELAIALRAEHPELTDQQVIALVNKHLPPDP